MNEPWDIRPIRQQLNSSLVIDFYTRGALAKALNRSVATIRKMEETGIIPHPRVRKTSREKNMGVWLYTREQIEALIQLATEEGVIDPRFHRQFSARFRREAFKILQQVPTA